MIPMEGTVTEVFDNDLQQSLLITANYMSKAGVIISLKKVERKYVCHMCPLSPRKW